MTILLFAISFIKFLLLEHFFYFEIIDKIISNIYFFY